MRVIEEDNIAYIMRAADSAAIHAPEAKDEEFEIVKKGEGVLYITGNDIYFGRRGLWYHITIDDIQIVKDRDGKAMSIVLAFTLPDNKKLEITIEGSNYAHMRAIRHLLSIYSAMKLGDQSGGRGGGIHGL